MGRQPRAEFRNALYHVFARGNRRERIFHDHDDYQLYIEELQKLSRDLGVDVLAYCLMPNHPHLCLRTRDTPLSRFMQRLNTFHAKRFNQKYDTSGHLYQGRYRALLIEERMHLLRLVRYIHQNPTRAGLVASMSDWPYSSYHEYRRADSWICRGPVLSGFGSLAAFAAFERDTPAPEDLETFSRARRAFAFAGSERGAAEVAARIREECQKPKLLWIPLGDTSLVEPEQVEPAAREWMAARRCPFTLETLQGPARHEPLRTYRRELVAFLRRRRYSLRSIALLLNRKESAI